MNHNGHRISVAPPSMLLPTKVAEHHFVDDSVLCEAFPTGQPSRWTSVPVLQWIESLAAATERADQRGTLTLDDDVALSEPSPPTLSTSDELYRCSTPPLVSDSMDDQACCWDLSYIEHNDPKAVTFTRKMKVLARNFEAMIGSAQTPQGVDEMVEAYQMVQTRLNFTFDRIMWQCRSMEVSRDELYTAINGDGVENSEMRVLMENLYEETIQKLNTLLSHYQPVPKGFNQKDSVVPAISRQNVGYPPNPSKTTSRHQSKQELGKFMTAWLRANFTNPYPDDEGLAQMAQHCGTTNQVISNWLINARTRKWRPAIIKACELGRPADFLLEDSINIFDGKPIRDIGTQGLHPRQEIRRSVTFIETKRASPKHHLNDHHFMNHLLVHDESEDWISIIDYGMAGDHMTLEEEYVPPDKRCRLY
jgi:Homeobox KN domain